MAWGQFLADSNAHGLKRSEFVFVDGVPGLEAALVALWGEDLPVQRCWVHKRRNFSIPRAFSLAAMALSVVQPAARMSSTTGARLSAKSSALRGAARRILSRLNALAAAV